MSTSTSHLFPALLRYWRTRRGFSQLELALESDVSSRHISFLESGRARPSEEMVLQLFTVMSVPLRDQNEALAAAGFEARFPSAAADVLAPEVDRALAQMMAQHEPFPLAVLSGDGVVLRQNEGARRLFQGFIASPEALPDPLDMYSLLFDPRLMRPFILEWESLARSIVSRLHREHLHRRDGRLGAVIERIFAQPGVPREWRHPDFSADVAPTLRLWLARDEVRLGFLIAVTTFSTPQHVAVDELRIESCFPLDDRTREACVRGASSGPQGAVGSDR
jgi:transcriptional regulator with XRE-family HTH domain